MNLYHLRYFAKLAHEQHYTKAAEKLCITQPSLSHAIAQLEKELGVPLFEKSNRNTTLTRFGQQFLTTVESSLATLDSGVESIQRYAKGEGLVRLGLLRTLGVDYIPGLMEQFQKENPNLHITFSLGIDVTQKLLEDLSAQQYDLVFSSKPNQEEAFDFQPVNKQDLVLIVPRDHPLADRCSIRLEDTLEYPYIYFGQKSGLRYVVDGLFEQVGERPMISYEIEEDQVIAGMVSHGFGIAVVPYMDMLLRLNVKIIQISHPVWDRKFFLVTNRSAYLTAAARKFYDFVLKNRLL